jgi:hypothetical protein
MPSLRIISLRRRSRLRARRLAVKGGARMDIVTELRTDKSRFKRGKNIDLELSLVVPVYNGAQTIAAVIEKIRRECEHLRYEIILVNDGSSDESESVLADLHEQYPQTISVIQLARNFGEHNAVLAGLASARGRYVAVLDDDGQNPPEAVPAMLAYAKEHRLDVVYSIYRRRKHSWLRVMGSRFNDRTANLILGKPKGLYLSSFKVMSRFVVDQLVQCTVPKPYIDGLILQFTRRIGQIEVEQHERHAGRSGYTLGRLAGLWMNMAVGSSLAPLRFLWMAGAAMMAASLLGSAGLLVAWASGVSFSAAWWIGACIIWVGGVLAVGLGLIGEYVGRAFLKQIGVPQYVVQHVCRAALEQREQTDSADSSLFSANAV